LTDEDGVDVRLDQVPAVPSGPSVADWVRLVLALAALVVLAMLLLGAVSPQPQCGGG
jgi:hypothetical protein